MERASLVSRLPSYMLEGSTSLKLHLMKQPEHDNKIFSLLFAISGIAKSWFQNPSIDMT